MPWTGLPYYLVKAALPEPFLRRSTVQAVKWEDENVYSATHSITEGDIGRILLDASQDHLEELKLNHQLNDCYVGGGNDREIALDLAQEFRRHVTVAVEKAGIHIDMECVEILKSNAHSEGTEKHMDQLQGGYNILAPMNDSNSTQLSKYGYEPYPQYLSFRSKVPADWASLESINISWEVGDLLVVRADYVHNAPKNTGEYTRFVYFSAGQSPEHEFSDSAVITQEVFKRLREVFRFHQHSWFLRYWHNQSTHNTNRISEMPIEAAPTPEASASPLTAGAATARPLPESTTVRVPGGPPPPAPPSTIARP
jgi:hypothetical protein